MNARYDFSREAVSPNAASLPQPEPPVKSAADEVRANSESFAQAARGSLIVNRLVPVAGDPGARRDPETGFVYYSSEWLSDGRVEGRRLWAVK